MKKLLYIIVFTTSLFHTSLFSQWIQQTVPVSKPIQGIKFINSNTGWACTGNSGSPNEGYVLHTSNGGTNWNIQLTNPSTSFNAIAVVNANVIYAGGSDGNGRLFKSINGGVNWIDIGAPSRVSDMQFLNQDSGYYCADFVGADVRTTTNGGLNWIVRTSGIAAQTQKIFFLNYNTGFCGANSNLYKTTNAGVNWNLHYNTSSTVHSIFFLNEQTGWVGITNNRIRFTSNSGVNWIEQTISPPSGPIHALYFFNQNTGWAGVTADYIFKTTNGGLNWGYQNVFAGSRELCFVDSLNGWCGYLSLGLISHTTNGGGNITYNSIQNTGSEIPLKFSLHQNYPNPFNPNTTIKVDIAKSSDVDFIIFDVLGKILYHENGKLASGSYEFKWDASKHSSGIYFYKLTAGDFTAVKRMVLIK